MRRSQDSAPRIRAAHGMAVPRFFKSGAKNYRVSFIAIGSPGWCAMNEAALDPIDTVFPRRPVVQVLLLKFDVRRYSEGSPGFESVACQQEPTGSSGCRLRTWTFRKEQRSPFMAELPEREAAPSPRRPAWPHPVVAQRTLVPARRGRAVMLRPQGPEMILHSRRKMDSVLRGGLYFSMGGQGCKPWYCAGVP